MIKVHDNRNNKEYTLGSLNVGKFFMINRTLYRRCWWEVQTFDEIRYEDDCLVCMNMADGELVALRYDQKVEYIPDTYVDLYICED